MADITYYLIEKVKSELINSGHYHGGVRHP